MGKRLGAWGGVQEMDPACLIHLGSWSVVNSVKRFNLLMFQLTTTCARFLQRVADPLPFSEEERRENDGKTPTHRIYLTVPRLCFSA